MLICRLGLSLVMSFSLTQDEKKEALRVYRDFLKQPSVSATGEGIREAATQLKGFLEELGIKASIYETKGHPVVTGEYQTGAGKTLLVYNHYDVQPVDPLSEWRHPPFSAHITDGKIYARGAADNKGTLIARLMGFSKLTATREPGLDFKFVFEGEEEIGSPHLEEFIHAKRDDLAADAVIMEGGGLDTRGRPQITLGVKGLLYVQLDTVIGRKDVHSSNAVVTENAAWKLVYALSTLRRPDGRVAIEGFYDDVKELAGEYLPMVEQYDIEPEELRTSLEVTRLTKKTKRELALALFNEPSCNIDGIVSGYTGVGSKTIVPARATVKIDFRLVPDQDPERVYHLLRSHLARMGFEGEIRALSFERPVRTSAKSPLVRAMTESAKRVYRKEPSLIPNTPGTQPMSLFTHTLGIADGVSAIGAGTPSSAVHAPNENVEIENFYRAVLHSAEFFSIYSGDSS